MSSGAVGLDGFVDALAERIASFDKNALAETKRLANLVDLPPPIPKFNPNATLS
jgi:hypothetical protein